MSVAKRSLLCQLLPLVSLLAFSFGWAQRSPQSPTPKMDRRLLLHRHPRIATS